MDFHFLLHGLKDALVAEMLLTKEEREIPEKAKVSPGGEGRAMRARSHTITQPGWRIA